MRANRDFSAFTVLFLVAFSLLCSSTAYSQCYLSQGCKPVDNLTYQQNGNGQIYHGDGASNNGTGGWTTYYTDVNQCLGCHYGSDTYPYLMSAHKNTMRKVAPGTIWAGADGLFYPPTDDYYGSGSVYNWTNGLVTMGWCDPLSVSAHNGVKAVDPNCLFPFYTLANANAPAPYSTVASTQAAGGVRNAYYLFGGWINYGDNKAHLGTIFDKGSTGELYPDGNFDCARCHATGYNFDNSGPEPTQNTNNKVAFIPDAQFSRIPTDGFVAPGTRGTSSWYMTGIQCERCHVAATGYGSHPWNPAVQPTRPLNEAATALCMECHRQENITMANNTTNPPTTGNISPANTLKTFDRGYCSDMSGSIYSVCVANQANTWVYKPLFKYGQGQEFLNSPHARFTGTLVQNAQHSADLSITIGGNYDSYFSENPTDPTKNKGCTGCHDPHQSTVAAVNGNPIVTKCDSCHRLADTILANVNHPAGPGTPFPTGTSADIPGACVTCHMQAALGTANTHLFRINPDVNYRTFPTPDQLYTLGITAPQVTPEPSEISGSSYSNAAWLDVDLACGQCHVGNDGKTTAYGLTLPPGMPGSHAYTRTQLAQWAAYMHNGDPGVPAPTFAPPPTTYYAPVSVTLSDSMNGATIYYTIDGSMPTTSSPVYSTAIALTTTTTIKAMATFPGLPRSSVVYATYSIVLPTAPPPTFKPTPSTYSTTQSVTLSNTAGLPMYYTTDGSTPTTSSTPYTVAIAVAKSTTINAITAGYGYLTSAVSSGAYFIQAPAPTFSPGSGTYSNSQSVTISDTATGAAIYYTTNGSYPTTSSTPCANPCVISVSATTTVKAIASGGGYVASNVTVATYTFAAATPTFSPAAGTYYTPITVTISDTTLGATIYYSTTGFPTTSSPSCSSPCTLSVSTTTTVRAMATGNGLSQSGTAVAAYTIAANNPTFSPPSGTYATPQTVTISDTTPGVTIYYSTTGFPTTSSPSCSSPCPVSVSTTTTIRAMAAGNGISQSGVAVATYTITGH